MEALFKKYFWVVNVLALVVAAYLTASTLNEYITDKLFAEPEAMAAGRADSRGAANVVLPWAEDAGENYVTVLWERNVFNAERSDVEAEPIEEKEPEVEPKAEGSDELEETSLDLKLIGTLVAPDPDNSLATVQLENNGKLVRVQSQIKRNPDDDAALATVLEIHRRHIVIQEGPDRRIVRLWGEKQAAAKRPTTPSRPTPTWQRGKPPTAPSKKTDYGEGVRKVSMYEYEVDRSMLEEQLNDLSAIGMQARIVPNYRDGQYQGFKLIGVRPNSLYRALGIRSGDVVKRVNGKEINSPNKAIELFEQLRSQSAIQLDIERRGQSRSLSYRIK